MITRVSTTSAANNLYDMTYNHLNLPTNINANGAVIVYTYDANGNKLRKLVSGSATVNNDYISGIHYEAGVLKFMSTAEGRVVKSASVAGAYNYEYTLADHLGNGRVYFEINASNAAVKIQEMDYYGFGLEIGRVVPSAKNLYLYNGKEKQEQEKLFDYGARFYDPVIGRFNVVDALSEEMRSHSPYNYGLNNPMRYTDPDGNAPTDIIIKGKGNSSVTIKTELIDIEVNASSLGVNFGGNYTLQGDDILQASLDIVGVFDPTGIADGVNAGISAKKGDWLNAGISALGVIPLAGDLAKAGKIEKDVKIISNAVDAVKTESKIVEASTKDASKGSLSGTKKALGEAKEKLGLKPGESLPKGEKGKFGSPQRGTSKKGYRLDPAHPNAKPGSGEEFPHINYWDYTNGKRGKGGNSGAIPIQ